MAQIKGIVTGALFGICMNVAYEDGCHRPGDKGLVTDSVVISETSVVNGICEHTVIQVREPVAPKPEPIPVRVQPVQPARTAPLTVDQIVAKAEQRKTQPKQPRLALPKEDAPVDAAIIEAAKKPPKLRSDLSTAPAAVQAVMKLPMEQRFDGDLSGYSPSEIAELQGTRTYDEPIGDGEPVNPFSSDFSASPAKPLQGSGPVRRGNKPVSIFNR